MEGTVVGACRTVMVGRELREWHIAPGMERKDDCGPEALQS